jgi:hypothetical protein
MDYLRMTIPTLTHKVLGKGTIIMKAFSFGVLEDIDFVLGVNKR